ncbi:hypothetical protein DOM22_16375 [Bdellovibrio sp. ZAP7]|uniref:hypothetical protein n=1 Tax=Bdellovibrio sp. ZAP7 TaxID=2231053 RepID=UPI00115BB439|nr:hypothetical protein [Bdellovibrio sp. ZAP7]QDK46617.1 hypothetical protein DOM22_16375 [Bdellovibrio sp. ZAP7]
MDTKSFPSRINSYLVLIPKHLGDILRLFIAAMLLIQTACTGGSSTTINQAPPPSSQASGNTRTSDPDGWGGGGTGDGGGGQGVLCSAETADTNLRGKLMVRDVYEAQYNYRRTMVTQGLGPAGTEKVDEATVNFILAALKRYYGPALRDIEIGYAKYWTDFSQKISFVPDQASLYPSKDANSPLALPKGCHIVQIAYWDESAGIVEDGTLYVDKSLWLKLDQFNKAALLAHEYFFKRAREAGFTNSDYARYKVGQLLSAEGMPPLFPGWVPSKDPQLAYALPESPKGYKNCNGSAGVRGSFIKLYQYKDDKGIQRIVIPSLKSSNYSLPPFQSVTTSFKPEPGDILGLITDQFIVDTLDPVPMDFNQNSITGKTSASHRGLENLSREIVALNIPTKNRTVKLAILNPMADEVARGKDELKSAAELALQMNYELEERLLKAVGLVGASKEDVLGAIAALNAEIDQALKAGSFPNGFPRWKAELDKMEQRMRASAAGAATSFSVARHTDLYTELPLVLYRIKQGTYSESEMIRVMSSNAYKKMNNQVRKIVQFSLSVDENKLDYGLDCETYSDVYRKITQAPDLEFSEQGLDNQVSADVVNRTGETVTTSTEAMHADLLKSVLTNGSLRDSFFRESFFAFADKECFVKGGESEESCLPALEFLADLKKEKSIQLRTCSEVTGDAASAYDSGGLYGICSVFDFKNLKRKYIARVFFRRSNEAFDVAAVHWKVKEKIERAGIDPKMPFLGTLERLPYTSTVIEKSVAKPIGNPFANKASTARPQVSSGH